jgi:hypothetical protein
MRTAFGVHTRKNPQNDKSKMGENGGGAWICRCVCGEEEGSGTRGKDALWEKMERERCMRTKYVGPDLSPTKL